MKYGSGIFCLLGVVWNIIWFADGACTFPDVIRGPWISSDKGTLNFTETTVVEYPLALSVLINSMTFACESQEGDKYMLKSQDTFLIFTTTYYAYICIEFHQISNYKYWYQIGTNIEPSNRERVYAADYRIPILLSDACNRPEPYETVSFSTLIKEGSVENGLAEATCPYDLFHTFSGGSLSTADGSKTCSNVTLDVCEDKTQMRHTYDPDCDASLQYTTDGVYICIMELTNETAGASYLHIWNNDSTLAAGSQRINCYAFAMSNNEMVATLYPGACQEGQTTTVVADPGIVVNYNTITKSCQVEEVETPLQASYSVAIILGALAFVLLAVLVACIIYKTKCWCIRKLFKKGKIGHSDTLLSDGEYLKTDLRDAPPGIFVPRKPIKLGPIIEPILEPPQKIDLLYDIEPRPTSSRMMFSRSIFLSQLSLKFPKTKDVSQS